MATRDCVDVTARDVLTVKLVLFRSAANESLELTDPFHFKSAVEEKGWLGSGCAIQCRPTQRTRLRYLAIEWRQAGVSDAYFSSD